MSKFAQVVFSNELARRLEGKGVSCNCVHPGIVDTAINREFPNTLSWMVSRFQSISAEEGARAVLFCALAPEVGDSSGRYFEDCKEVPPSPSTHNRGLMEKLWEQSEIWTGL